MGSLFEITGAFIFAFTSAAALAAEPSIQGTWKFVRQECASGAPFTQLLTALFHFDSLATFSDTEMHFTLHMSSQLSEDDLRTKFSEFLAELKQMQSLPDNDEKFRALKTLNEKIKSAEAELNGFSCTLTSVDKYTLAPAGALHIGPNVSLVSNCPGTEHAGPEGYDAKIEMTGANFKMTDAKAETSDTGSCPKGDHTVTIFEPVVPSTPLSTPSKI